MLKTSLITWLLNNFILIVIMNKNNNIDKNGVDKISKNQLSLKNIRNLLNSKFMKNLAS